MLKVGFVLLKFNLFYVILLYLSVLEYLIYSLVEKVKAHFELRKKFLTQHRHNRFV